MSVPLYALLILVAGYAVDLTLTSDVSKAFESYDIVSDYNISKAPDAILEVKYGCRCCKKVKLGNELTPTEAKDPPKVSYEADEDQYYTLVMTNYDVPSRENHTMGEYIYWIVGNIPGNKVKDGETLVEYIGPGPLKGTCFHRYVLLVYKQPQKLCFNETRLDNKSKAGRYYFKVGVFADKYGLGVPVAGNFFIGQYDKYVDELNKKLGSNQTTVKS